MKLKKIENAIYTASEELFSQANPIKDQILVIGCSTSEVIGEKIGTCGSEETAKLLYKTLSKQAEKKGLFIAAQCCEHLNRALVVSKKTAEKYNLTIVSAIPHPKAGGAFATAVYETMKSENDEPVLVENISAHLGIDIGNTLIGMHLLPVAVPVRTSIYKIGEAHITFARTRPKYIGGERTKYI